MFFAVRIGSEGGLIEGIDHILDIQSVFARYRFDVAVVARASKVKFFENIGSFGVKLFDIPDNHVAADQTIESKHWQVSE